jgi:hypothetical protein
VGSSAATRCPPAARANFDRFAQERIGPAMAAIGLEAGPPEVHEFPVHEHFPR